MVRNVKQVVQRYGGNIVVNAAALRLRLGTVGQTAQLLTQVAEGVPIHVYETGAPGTYVDNGSSVVVPTNVTNGSAAWVWRYTGPLYLEWFGAVGDGVTDDFQAIKNCLVMSKSSGLDVRAAGSGKTFAIGDRLEFDDTYDGLRLDLGNNVLKARTAGLGFLKTSLVEMLNGQTAYNTGVVRPYKRYTINVGQLRLDGAYNHAAFIAAFEAAYDASPNMSDGSAQTLINTHRTSGHGPLIYGLVQSFYTGSSPSPQGSLSNAMSTLVADRILVQNFGNSAIRLINPNQSRINSVELDRCASVGLSALIETTAAEIRAGDWGVTIGDLICRDVTSPLTLNSSNPAFSNYAEEKVGHVKIDQITIRNQLGSNSVQMPWWFECRSFISEPQHRGCRRAVFNTATVADYPPIIKIDHFAANQMFRGIQGNARWRLGDVYLVKVRERGIYKLGDSSRIDRLFINAARLPFESSGYVGSLEYHNQYSTDANYWCKAAGDTPFSATGKLEIDRVTIQDPSFSAAGVNNAATYMWRIEHPADGSRFGKISTGTDHMSGDDFTWGSDWSPDTSVATGDIMTGLDPTDDQSLKAQWRSNATRTTGGTLNDTERGFWTRLTYAGGETQHLFDLRDRLLGSADTSRAPWRIHIVQEASNSGYLDQGVVAYSHSFTPSPTVWHRQGAIIFEVKPADHTRWSKKLRGISLSGNLVTVTDSSFFKWLPLMVHGSQAISANSVYDFDNDSGDGIVTRYSLFPVVELTTEQEVELQHIYMQGAGGTWVSSVFNNQIFSLGLCSTDSESPTVINAALVTDLYGLVVIGDGKLSLTGEIGRQITIVVVTGATGANSLEITPEPLNTPPTIPQIIDKRVVIRLLFDGSDWLFA